MKQFNHLLLLLLVVMFTFSSCELVGDIFQAGMWIGIVIVVLIVALILWIVGKFRR